MKKILLASALLLIGFSCNQVPMTDGNQAATTDQNPQEGQTDTVVTGTNAAPTSTAKLAVARSFTVDEIETEGEGLKEWFRQLARANVAGKKTLVRVPINQVWGFGCLTPTRFCVSTMGGGCYGPFVDLKGKFSQINNAVKSCLEVCDLTKSETEQKACTPEFLSNMCSAVWGVEGYVVAATRLPEAKDDGSQGGTCADGELVYDFEVTKVIGRLNSDTAESFVFTEFK